MGKISCWSTFKPFAEDTGDGEQLKDSNFSQISSAIEASQAAQYSFLYLARQHLAELYLDTDSKVVIG
jgi:hypothetical protein